MKKFILVIILTCCVFLSETVSAETYSKNNHKEARLKLRYGQLGLIQITDSCPQGYGGTGVTYWLVYDTETGAIVGYGAYSQCYPVAYC